MTTMKAAVIYEAGGPEALKLGSMAATRNILSSLRRRCSR